MESVILVEGKAVIRLHRIETGLSLQVENHETREILGEFPVTAPLLKAVLSGFSYQIANQWGSLQITSADGLVKIEFQSLTKQKIISRTENHFFSDAITNLTVN
jgi:hypothetical protein